MMLQKCLFVLREKKDLTRCWVIKMTYLESSNTKFMDVYQLLLVLLARECMPCARPTTVAPGACPSAIGQSVMTVGPNPPVFVSTTWFGFAPPYTWLMYRCMYSSLWASVHNTVAKA
jgi:hypothetical protein